MNIKFIMIVMLAGLFLTGSVYAQKATKFTSVYTNLTKGCKVLKGGDGQDDAAICPGVGGYKVRQYYSAQSIHLIAELKGNPESVSLLMTLLGFNEKKATLEWRLANGKPFAVILRKPVYADSAEPTSNPKPIGEELEVMGLLGYSSVAGKVDAKAPNANVKARELADAAYKAQAK